MEQNENKIVTIIGYSGHAYVVIDALLKSGITVTAYCDKKENIENPYGLYYLGLEDEPKAKEEINGSGYFVGIGNNRLRKKIMLAQAKEAISAIHPRAVLADHIDVGDGTLLAANSVINPMCWFGRGAIINTGAIVEHECRVGAFAHVAPGAVLAGNVTVGEGAFVGAGAVVKQGVIIGDWAVVGAGAVVIKDVAPGTTVVGNPARYLRG